MRGARWSWPICCRFILGSKRNPPVSSCDILYVRCSIVCENVIAISTVLQRRCKLIGEPPLSGDRRSCGLDDRPPRPGNGYRGIAQYSRDTRVAKSRWKIGVSSRARSPTELGSICMIGMTEPDGRKNRQTVGKFNSPLPESRTVSLF